MPYFSYISIFLFSFLLATTNASPLDLTACRVGVAINVATVDTLPETFTIKLRKINGATTDFKLGYTKLEEDREDYFRSQILPKDAPDQQFTLTNGGLFQDGKLFDRYFIEDRSLQPKRTYFRVDGEPRGRVHFRVFEICDAGVKKRVLRAGLLTPEGLGPGKPLFVSILSRKHTRLPPLLMDY